MKLVIFIVVCALFARIQAQVDSQEDDDLLSDYWSNEFDYDEYAENNQAIADRNENLEENFDDINKEFDAKISELKENPDVEPNLDSKYDSFLDYQVEDNRLSINDKDAIKVNIDDEPDKEPIPDDAPENIRDDSAILPLKLADDDDDDAWEDIIENIVQDISMSELENPSLEKSQETANDEDNFDENLNDQISSDEFPEIQSVEKTDVNEILDDKPLSEEVPASQLAEVADSDQPKRDEDLNELPDNTLPKLMGQSDLDQIIEETSKLLLESDDNFKADDYDFEEKRSEFFDKDHNDEIADDVLSDLNDDLDKLLETLDKLSDNNSDLGNVDDNMEAVDDFDNIKDYEEKFDRPYREGYILSLRDDLDKSDHSNLPDIFAANAKNDTGEDNESANKTSVEIEVTVDDKKNQVDSTKLAEEELTDNKDEELDEFDYSEIDKLLTYLDNNSDSKEDNGSDLKHPYGNDGLENDQQPLNEDAEIMSTTEADLITETTTEIASKIKDKIILQNATKPENQPTQQKMVDELSSSEYTDLMSQFAIAHSEDLDMRSEDFGKNVAPIHITLSVDKPTIITSPGHPDFYPTNNIIDWIIEGPGIGIEMNVTDLDINGVLGDYLLVKPGGIDESGTDGLIFSFRLNTERRYRFTNVNRMFVRFEAKPGIAFCTGFSFSARMIWPLPEIVTEEIPEPEPVLNPPEETLVLNLSGLTLQQFEDVSPKFKNLIADMAQEYIKDNEIDPGQNTTLEVTQITRLAICNIRWPNYETCVEVTFGVPLHYAQDNETPRLSTEDLDTMWRTYMEKEQYASRLKEIGITEYSMPNDKTVLMVWLVIAGGVVISMAMLAFALWRFSCFEDYTRMRAFNDTDSVQNEKRNLDLYPTPHQTLPPLYTENDYKWADDKYNDSTRVDMGGFANKSYIRDNLFEFDSDEDIITPHDRYTTNV